MVTRRRLLGAGAAMSAATALSVYVYRLRTGGGPGLIGGDGGGSGGGGALGTVEFFPPEQRQPAPAVTGELLDGAAFDLADWSGQVVVINWWGSWCAPCRAEAPDLRAVYDATHQLGVEFLGVDVRDGRDAALAFHQAFEQAWPSLFDPGGQVALGFREVPPTVVPTTLLLDRQHRIAAVFRRRVYRDELEDAVRDLTAEET